MLLNRRYSWWSGAHRQIVTCSDQDAVHNTMLIRDWWFNADKYRTWKRLPINRRRRFIDELRPRVNGDDQIPLSRRVTLCCRTRYGDNPCMLKFLWNQFDWTSIRECKSRFHCRSREPMMPNLICWHVPPRPTSLSLSKAESRRLATHM